MTYFSLNFGQLNPGNPLKRSYVPYSSHLLYASQKNYKKIAEN